MNFARIDTLDAATKARLALPEARLAVCFCAAWCRTCAAWEAEFGRIAADNPDWDFLWVDIEENPELLQDQDVEDFPSIWLVHGAQSRYWGSIQPLAGVLQRLLAGAAQLPRAECAPDAARFLQEIL